MTRMIRYLQFRLDNNGTGRRGRTGLIISTVLAGALVIALMALALGLALVLIPVVAVGVLIATWRLHALRAALARALEESGRKWDHDEPQTIEAEYTIIKASDRKSP